MISSSAWSEKELLFLVLGRGAGPRRDGEVIIDYSHVDLILLYVLAAAAGYVYARLGIDGAAGVCAVRSAKRVDDCSESRL